jgi:hypothetical protein
VVDKLRFHPNWNVAHRLLSSVRPGSTGFELDKVAGVIPGDWEAFPTKGRPDAAIGHDLLVRIGERLSGVVIVVTPASYLQHAGPFFVDAANIRMLIAEHAELFRGPFFGGDVIIVAPGSGTVVLVHRNGLLAVLDSAPVPTGAGKGQL